MNALETGTLPDLRAQVHEGTKRVRKKIQETLEEWFQICDHILDAHRSRFLFREPTPVELEEHKIAVSECIETCKLMAAQLDSRSAAERDLLARLQIRIRQLKDAYDTFHDPSFSDEEARRILKQVFPE